MMQKVINFHYVTKVNIREHDPNQPQSPDHSYILLTVGGSGSGKASSLFNLTNPQTDIV